MAEVVHSIYGDLPLASTGAPDPPVWQGHSHPERVVAFHCCACSSASYAPGTQQEEELTVLVDKAVLIPV